MTTESRTSHQQPEVNYLPRVSPQLISLTTYTLSVYIAGEIDLFENLDIVQIRLLVDALVHDSVPALAPDEGLKLSTAQA